MALPATSLGVPVIDTGTSKWLSSDVSVRNREDDTLQHRQFLGSDPFYFISSPSHLTSIYDEFPGNKHQNRFHSKWNHERTSAQQV